MKRYKLLFIILGGIVASSLVSCLKTDDQTYVDFSKSPALVIFASPNSAAGSPSIVGLSGYKNANFSFVASDTAKFDFYVNYAGLSSAPSDIKVTIGADDAKRTAYNTANGTNFQALPATAFKIAATSVTISKGSQYAKVSVKLINNGVNPTVSYMLPVSITDASGVNLSSNLNTVYFNFIGNPIAGPYTRLYNRWNAATATGAPTTTTTQIVPFIPDDPTTVEAQSGYGTQNGFNCRYLIKFTNTAGVISGITVQINPDDVKNSLTPSSITLSADATIITADPVAGHYKFAFSVVNSAGAARTFTDEFTK